MSNPEFANVSNIHPWTQRLRSYLYHPTGRFKCTSIVG